MGLRLSLCSLPYTSITFSLTRALSQSLTHTQHHFSTAGLHFIAFQSSVQGPYVYELFSIMIHSGSAIGGHYFAYIKSVILSVCELGSHQRLLYPCIALRVVLTIIVVHVCEVMAPLPPLPPPPSPSPSPSFSPSPSTYSVYVHSKGHSQTRDGTVSMTRVFLG